MADSITYLRHKIDVDSLLPVPKSRKCLMRIKVYKQLRSFLEASNALSCSDNYNASVLKPLTICKGSKSDCQVG